jgi:DNA-binding CsgD family transcriptional regulator
VKERRESLEERCARFKAAVSALDAVMFTRRQRQVVKLRTAGFSFAEIGRRLRISGERVRQIEARLMSRANIRSRSSFGTAGMTEPNIRLKRRTADSDPARSARTAPHADARQQPPDSGHAAVRRRRLTGLEKSRRRRVKGRDFDSTKQP